jgi:hypothetical protein
MTLLTDRKMRSDAPKGPKQTSRGHRPGETCPARESVLVSKRSPRSLSHRERVAEGRVRVSAVEFPKHVKEPVEIRIANIALSHRERVAEGRVRVSAIEFPNHVR